MQKVDFIVIGASSAGINAAVMLKKLQPEKKVACFRDVSKTLIPCGIPYIFGILKGVEKDIVPDSRLTSAGVEIKNFKVNEIDINNNRIFFNNGDWLSYEKLIIATGSKPIIPPIQGIKDNKNIFVVKKDPDYLKKLYKKISESSTITIIGGGFIGVEVAEQIKTGFPEKEVTIIEMLPHCLMNVCEPDFCIKIEEELEKIGVVLKTNSMVKKIEQNQIILNSGEQLESDLIILAIGVTPNIELAEKSGIKAEKYGIVVNESMQTEIENIYSCGDCIKKFSFIDNSISNVRLASVAIYEARVAAFNISNINIKNKGTVGAFATKVGNISIGAAGVTEQYCEKNSIKYFVGTATSPDRHPIHIPDVTKEMKIKLIFKKEDEVLIGAHILGGNSTSEMMNLLSLAIQKRLTFKELAFTQFGTHPLLTASPGHYHVNVACFDILLNLKR